MPQSSVEVLYNTVAARQEWSVKSGNGLMLCL